jgi:hypothetical protein
MNLRPSAFFACTLAFVLTACPTPAPNTDGGAGGGNDSGNPMPEETCSGGCGPNQVCDAKPQADGGPARRVCVEACAANGGTPCTGGKICAKGADGKFSCQATVTQCNGNTCEPGQVACIGSACSCLPTNRAAKDSCSVEGKWCVGSACVPPKALQNCVPGTGAACPTGQLCSPVFCSSAKRAAGTCDPGEYVCSKQCGMLGGVCDRGDLCFGSDGCLPSTFAQDQECMQLITLADGGSQRLTVPVSNKCLLKDTNGNPTEPSPTGNCTYQMLGFYDQGNVPFATCRPPGTAALGATCKQDYAPSAIATSCNSGMECALTRGGDQGVCLKMCNAAPTYPGFSPTPACDQDESCTNIYRLTDMNAVLGVCMKKCNVFDPVKSVCSPVGSAPASCVPTPADGKAAISTDGSGVCVPQQQTLAQVGMPCATQDSFKGATCASGQVCAALNLNEAPVCNEVCDTDCGNATPPARCATEPHANCAAGKKCTKVTSTSGATLGFCL